MGATIDYDTALSDPAACFNGPEAVKSAASLSTEQKVAILRQWEYDQSELAVAQEEGMLGNDGSLLQRIAKVLAELDPAGDDRPAPTKHRVPPSS